MAPRTRPPHPQERRARRLRAVFLSCFAAFLLLALFAVAAYGFMIGRTAHPVSAVPAIAPDGLLVVNLDRIIPQISPPEMEGAPPGTDYLGQELRTMKAIFASHAQVFFWDADPSLEIGPRWALFLPIVRPHALFLRRLEKTIADSNVLPSEGETLPSPAAPRLAHHRLMRQGLLLSSEPRLPDVTFRPADDPPPGEAVYTAPRGYLPAFLRDMAEGAGLAGDACPELCDLEITWAPPGAAGEIRLVYSCGEETRSDVLPHQPLLRAILSAGGTE